MIIVLMVIFHLNIKNKNNFTNVIIFPLSFVISDVAVQSQQTGRKFFLQNCFITLKVVHTCKVF